MEETRGDMVSWCGGATQWPVTLGASLYYSPYRHDGLPVLAVARPDGYFVAFGPDVDHGAAHVVARLVERLAD